MRPPPHRGGAGGGRRDSGPPEPSGRHDAGRRSGGRGSALEKVTVNLTSRSAEALEKTVAGTGDSKTDVINKAVQLYAFVQDHIDAGGLFYIRDPDSTEVERLRIL